METDPNKLRELRLNQPHMTSEEAWEQFKQVQEEASRYAETAKQPRSETGRVRED
jgi:hypothetical protein